MNRTMPIAGVPAAIRLPELNRTTLVNGMQAVLIERHALPVVDLQLVIPAGATAHNALQTGLASLTAEMLDEGTRTRSARQIAEELETLGARLSVRATWDATIVSLHVLASRLQPALELLFDILENAAFPEDEFARKRAERVHELDQENAEPRAIAAKAAARAVFPPSHPYAMPLHGTVDAARAFDIDAIRGFAKRALHNKGAFVVVAGDVHPDATFALLEHYIGAWAATGDRAPIVLPRPERNVRRVIIIDRPAAPQSEVRIAHPAPARALPEYFDLVVMNTIFGGSFRSWLNQELREKRGFTYGASTAYALRRDGGFFGGGSAVFTDASAETVRITLELMNRMRDVGPTEAEVERARNYLAFGLPRNLETTDDLASAISEIMLYALEPDFLQTYAARLAEITPERVVSAARKYLKPDEVVFAIAGDASKIRGPLEQLDIAVVEEVKT